MSCLEIPNQSSQRKVMVRDVQLTPVMNNHLDHDANVTNQDIIDIYHHLRRIALPNEYLKLNLVQRIIKYDYPQAVMQGCRSIRFGSLRRHACSSMSHSTTTPLLSPSMAKLSSWMMDDPIEDSDQEDNPRHINQACVQHHMDDPIEDSQDDHSPTPSTPQWFEYFGQDSQSCQSNTTASTQPRVINSRSNTLTLDMSVHTDDDSCVDDVDDDFSFARRDDASNHHASTLKIYFEDDPVSLYRWWPEERVQVLQVIDQHLSSKSIHTVQASRRPMSAHLNALIIPSSIQNYAPKQRRAQNRAYAKLVRLFNESSC